MRSTGNRWPRWTRKAGRGVGCALDHSPVAGLDRRRDTLARDDAGESPFGKHCTGVHTVAAAVEADLRAFGRLAGAVADRVQGRREQAGVVPVRAVGHDTDREACGLGGDRAFQGLLAAVDQRASGLLTIAIARGLGDAAGRRPIIRS